ncbi:sensor histidine kinase [Anabaena sp. UHCC 0451]|uniref:sensor histidine kinase n=1 Tax=Anabaena sp. UHCC 0451 TaxID=2055235 RepID=UPI002B1FC4D2|nr:ATP-binding protein [Anabaena sp. UHCC 0451]MEA5577438.1 ATP-binding protein [Anabaena sp. UHCC 0451]
MNSGDYIVEKFKYKFSFQPELELNCSNFLINEIGIAAFCLGENAQFLYVNKATCALTEYSQEELLSMKLVDLDVDFLLHNWSEKWQHLQNIKRYSFKSRYRTKGEKIFLAEVNLIYLKYQDHEFCCALIREKGDELIELTIKKWIDEGRTAKEHLHHQQIAEIKPRNIETLLKLRDSRFRTLLEAIHASIFLIQGTQIRYVNPAVELLTGYSQQELLAGFDFSQLIKSRKSQPIEAANCEYQEINILTKDGTERWLDVVVTRLDGGIDFDGQEVEILTAIDITDYKNSQLELHQTLEQAQQLSKLRADLIPILCHQFRTPLNIISFSNSLLKRHIDKWEREKILIFLEHIRTSVKQINQVLDDILFLSKTELVKTIFDPTTINLLELCQNLITKILIIHNDRYIDFHNQGNCLNVWIDPKMLEPILNNLLDNAIKYSPPSSMVDLMVCCDQEKITFRVKDKGIGIPEIDQQRLFEPFYRGSNVNNISGTGLGLSIVKTLVDLYGGQITVVSKIGVGTTFTVVLPSVLCCDSGIT